MLRLYFIRNRNTSINSVMSPRVELSQSEVDIKSEALSPDTQSDSSPMLHTVGTFFRAPLEYSKRATGATFTPQLSSSATPMAPMDLTSSQLSNSQAAADGGFANPAPGGTHVSLTQSQVHATGFNFPTYSYSTPSNPIFLPAVSAQSPIGEHLYSNLNTLETNAQSQPLSAHRPITLIPTQGTGLQLQQWDGLGKETIVGQPSGEMSSNFDTEIEEIIGMVNPLMTFCTSIPQHTRMCTGLLHLLIRNLFAPVAHLFTVIFVCSLVHRDVLELLSARELRALWWREALAGQHTAALAANGFGADGRPGHNGTAAAAVGCERWPPHVRGAHELRPAATRQFPDPVVGPAVKT